MTDTGRDIDRLLDELGAEEDKRVGQPSETPQPVEAAGAELVDSLSQAQDSLNDARRARGEDPVKLVSPALTATLGVELRRRGRNEEALPLLRVAADAGDAMAAGTLGLIMEEQGDLGEAHKWFLAAAAAGDDQARYNLARILLDKGDRNGAEWWLKQSKDPLAEQLLASLGD
jgi:TPR repeat protein